MNPNVKIIEEIYNRVKVVNNVKIIEGNIYWNHLELTELPDLSDVIVNGDFTIGFNKLTSLKGSPKEVKGYFGFAWNNISSFIYMPKHVFTLTCNHNPIKNLNHIMLDMTGTFNCDQFTDTEYRLYCNIERPKRELLAKLDKESTELFSGIINSI